MRRVLVYSLFLMAGIAVSQSLDLSTLRPTITTLTLLCLSYIMVEVGLEFTIEKDRLSSYGWDYVVAATAAAFPWVFCTVYFVWVLDAGWRDALLVGRFAAPTSAGVLFAMLAAAGLASSWLFRKVRVLAIFDDLDTILFLIPLQAMFVGLRGELAVALAIILGLLAAAWRWLNRLHWRTGTLALLGYAAFVVAACELLERSTHVHLEILLPAFVFGCVLFNPRDHSDVEGHGHGLAESELASGGEAHLDLGIKLAFMFLVGSSLPPIELGDMSASSAAMHVLLLTALSNLGKCFPVLCYRREATARERVAAAVAMFPRGEVGAGVLLIAIGYGLTGPVVTLSALSLALNLLLTGPFILLVLWLVGAKEHRVAVHAELGVRDV